MTCNTKSIILTLCIQNNTCVSVCAHKYSHHCSQCNIVEQPDAHKFHCLCMECTCIFVVHGHTQNTSHNDPFFFCVDILSTQHTSLMYGHESIFLEGLRHTQHNEICCDQCIDGESEECLHIQCIATFADRVGIFLELFSLVVSSHTQHNTFHCGLYN